MNPEIRYPAVAEAFYPADIRELETLITSLLQQVKHEDKKRKKSGRS